MNIATSVQPDSMNAYSEIYEHFFDNAAFLWVLRSIAVDQPHYGQHEIFELEQRIETQLDGLMTSIDQAWPVCIKALELEEPGEVFAATILAFRSHDMNKIQYTVEVGLSNEQAVKGLISALGWLPGKLVHSWIKKFLSSKDLNHKYLAIATCSVRRENPEAYLNRILDREDCRNNLKLYRRSLRLIGELRRQDLMPYLNQALKSEDHEIQFWAIWSSILLGNHAIAKELKPYIFKPGAYQYKAINLAFRTLPIEHAREWISKLSENKAQLRCVIKASGVLGDPHAINWLISQMKDGQAAKVAGEAFSDITGIDLSQSELVDESFVDQILQPNEDIDDTDVSMDEDENLPFPDYDKIKKFWMNHGKNFIAGKRYFLGKQISPEFVKSRLPDASQRQRQAAAFELALIDTAVPLINYRSRIQR